MTRNTHRFVARIFSKLWPSKGRRKQRKLQPDTVEVTPGESDSNQYANSLTQEDQSKNEYKVIKDLAKRVSKKFKENKNLDGIGFLPCSSLKEFANDENVRSVIAEANLENASNLVNFVLAGSERLFLILVLISDEGRKGLSLLDDLYLAKISDAALPFGFEYSEERDSWSVVSCEPSAGELLFSVTKKWGRNDTALFEHYQWQLLAPVFGADFHYHFHASRILPYKRMKLVSGGHFGDVSQVEILAAHIPAIKTNSDTDTVPIAVKKAKLEDPEMLEKYFSKEVDILEQLRAYDLQHLIKPVAAYRFKEDRCLIFPWATGGNLGDYWKTNKTERQVPESIRWILDQIVGICSALKELHRENCRHGDLKPENILWFKEPNNMGTLKIADLGLAAFHAIEENTDVRRNNHDKTGTPESGTSRYEPPEMDATRGTSDPRSRQYDVWSIGCVILELLVWLVYGFEKLELFRRDTPRYFWDVEGQQQQNSSRYIINPYIEKLMAIMIQQLRDNVIYKELLQLVKTKLLIIPVSSKYESLDGCREIAGQVFSITQAIQKKYQGDPSCLRPVDLEYPSMHQSLAVPGQRPTPQIQAAPTISDLHSQDDTQIPQIIVRAATGDIGPRHLTARIPGNQEVGEFTSRAMKGQANIKANA